MKVIVANRCTESVALIGAEKACRCRVDDNLPVTVDSSGYAEIDVKKRIGQLVFSKIVFGYKLRCNSNRCAGSVQLAGKGIADQSR